VGRGPQCRACDRVLAEPPEARARHLTGKADWLRALAASRLRACRVTCWT